MKKVIFLIIMIGLRVSAHAKSTLPQCDFSIVNKHTEVTFLEKNIQFECNKIKFRFCEKESLRLSVSRGYLEEDLDVFIEKDSSNSGDIIEIDVKQGGLSVSKATIKGKLSEVSKSLHIVRSDYTLDVNCKNLNKKLDLPPILRHLTK